MKKFGLSDEQVQASREKYGTNSLTEQKRESFWSKLLENFGDPMIKILCVALIINVIMVFFGQSEWYEAVGIAVAVIIATFVSTISEHNNENAFQKLQEEASLIKVKVFRNGTITEISINDIVVGDCVMLQSGDKIPADGIIVDGSLAVDQSVLNGESKEAKKIAVPENFEDKEEAMDFLNPYKVFRGAVVCSGNAVMEVTVVGDKSVYGQIASELQTDDDRDSPLKVKLAKLANGISKFGYIGGIAIAVAFMLKAMLFFSHPDVGNGFAGYFAAIGSSIDGLGWMMLVSDIIEAVMLAVVIIVMAVPEGLPLMIALVSAMNMKKMLKDNVLVRKVNGIETAGSLNILFSDKTGTITKGKLEAVVYVDGAGKESKSHTDMPKGQADLLTMCLKGNTTALISGEGKDLKIVGGNPTERAVLMYVAQADMKANLTTVSSIPFNSTNKYSATTVSGDYNLTLIKGAPEKIIERCSHYYDADGKKQKFNSKVLNAKIDELAVRAIRVLAVATADAPLKDDALPNENNWTLVGVLGIRDEVRPESVTAIKEVQNAGVQVVMITGDRKETAVAIAKDAGIIKNDTDLVFTSDELAKMSDEEIKKVIPNIRVVARALPTDKSRLVTIAQSLNLVVGMTGDGVNDSPALKKADIGFAMGSGTEVAKEASDIVILDDNFNSIDKAILYGRTIFNNIRKFVVFQLTINIAAVLVSFIMPLCGLEEPLTITQILWVNLIMDTLAALALGGEPALERYMTEKPKRRDESIISKKMKSQIALAALWVVGLGVAMLFLCSPTLNGPLAGVFFRIGDGKDLSPDAYVKTAYFCFFILVSVFNALNVRSERLNLFERIKDNKTFLGVMGIIIVIQVALTYLGGNIFQCYGLTWNEWLAVLVMAVSIIPLDLIRKLIVNAVIKDK